ncbi:hypothetical protein ASD56_02315 [Microbacterium sp. Root166]|uniref:enoyl-CoA hydratase/isomerase family protein n=1 Tax=Microbacterium sp. Root166 TaxID=1736478 RepID=UPI0006F4CB36|nr:enoyl-CoA hydratase/isomerase family protein [Microbacterium sp. Root166]KQZ85217.1 hypothetical protein ASD56_02315 [Microbacterium sp. Root166]
MVSESEDRVFQESPVPGYPAFQAIEVGVDDGVAVVTLGADPDGPNPTTAMTPELLEFFRIVREDPTVRAVVLVGRGKVFSAGGDVKVMGERSRRMDPSANPAWVKRLPVDRATDFMTALLEVDVPVVAAVNGHAVGAGLRIAMLCDYVVVADDAKVGDPHVMRGLVAPQAVLLGELIGARRARSLVLTGRLLRGEEVVEWGLADEAVARDEVLERALSQARELAMLPPLAFRWTKRALNNRLKAAIAQYASEGYALEALTMLSTDHAEAAASFAEKREPRPYEGR